MTRWFLSVTFALTVVTGAVAAGKGPEIDLVDNKLSVDAEAISLGRLLQLFDMATGMKSKVPAELANRNLSVKFSGLGVTDGVRKIFQGQPLDYVMIEGQGIFVTALSQAPSASDSAAPAAYTPPPQPQPFEQPVLQEFPPPMNLGQPAQPQQQQ